MEQETTGITCPGCKNEIDPDVCHCGEAREAYCHSTEHSFVPMGCDCGRVKEEPRG